MFISKSEKNKIFARLHLLENITADMFEQIKSLEATTNELSKINKTDLDIRAKKLAQQKERQREYNRAYKARLKARKEAAQVIA